MSGFFGISLVVTRLGFGFASRRLPPPRTSHRLAVWLACKLAKHRSGVLIPTRAKQFARCRGKNKNTPQKRNIFICDPAGIRTQDHQLKRLSLYQAELPGLIQPGPSA